MNDSTEGQQCCTPSYLRNVVSEVLQSEEFCNQLRCSIERASSNSLLFNRVATALTPRIPAATRAEELGRMFPSTRGSNHNERVERATYSMRAGVNRTTERRRNRRGGSVILSADFTRDVILVKSPGVKKVLDRRQKGRAYAEGYAVSAVSFKKSWTEREILEYIESLFGEKLFGTKLEILIPIGGSLVKPNLAEGTAFEGIVMCRLFAQKIVYVRPLTEILQEGRCPNNYEFDNEPNATEENTSGVENIGLGNYNVCAGDHHEIEDHTVNVYEPDLLNLPRDVTSAVASSDGQNVMEELLEYDVKAAIALSLQKNEETLIEVLKGLHNRIDPEKTSKFNVYREDIFNCCVRGLRRKTFSPLFKMSVLFTDIDNVSEGALNMGGPTREMFRLLLKYLANSMLFEGPNQSKNITLCNEHVESKHYYEAGRIIALSLVHGGPSPHFFSETLFNYLVSGVEATRPNIEEVMDTEVRKDLERIRDASDLAELQLIIWDSTFMTLAGFASVNNFDQKETILEGAIKYYLIYRTTPALEQFKEGLNILGLLDKLKGFKNEFRQLMCYNDSKLTAVEVSSTFTVKFSEPGSNRRSIESRILGFWEEYLIDCEGIVQNYKKLIVSPMGVHFN